METFIDEHEHRIALLLLSSTTFNAQFGDVSR